MNHAYFYDLYNAYIILFILYTESDFPHEMMMYSRA